MLKLLQTAGNVELFTSTTELPSPLPKPAPSIWNAGAAGGDFSQLGVKVLAPVFALVNIIWVAGVLRFSKDPKHHVWFLTIHIWQRKHERRRNFSNLCELKPAQFLSLPALNVNLVEEAQKATIRPHVEWGRRGDWKRLEWEASAHLENFLKLNLVTTFLQFSWPVHKVSIPTHLHCV